MADSMIYTDSDLVITVFDSALSTRVIRHPERAFALEATFNLRHAMFVTLSSKKPPMHFHQHQEEYLQVLEGPLAFEHAGNKRMMIPSDGKFTIRPGINHRAYPVAPEESDDDNRLAPSSSSTLKSLISGEKTTEVLSLNLLFFENCHLYQEQLITKGQKPDFIQVLSTFDPGGSYLSLPEWVPFGRSLALGRLLGYQPFYREWSTDWDLACSRMRHLPFQMR
ncbi:hypothetical protein F4810DRAFT_704926 [Camillea tinctor]|nr:hypothetical protein F4810DRAFT_704926 [Camillea tinctor]